MAISLLLALPAHTLGGELRNSVNSQKTLVFFYVIPPAKWGCALGWNSFCYEQHPAHVKMCDTRIACELAISSPRNQFAPIPPHHLYSSCLSCNANAGAFSVSAAAKALSSVKLHSMHRHPHHARHHGVRRNSALTPSPKTTAPQIGRPSATDFEPHRFD